MMVTRAAAISPVFSPVGICTRVTARSASVRSVTASPAAPERSPAAWAMTVTGFVPSGVPSSTPVAVKVASAAPAAMVTLAGSANSPARSGARVTTRAAALSAPIRRTVPVAERPSPTVSWSKARATRAPSSSRIWKPIVRSVPAMARPSTPSPTLARSTVRRLPSATALSRIVMGTVTDAWPAAMTARGSSRNCPTSPPTRMFSASAVTMPRVMVSASAPDPSPSVTALRLRLSVRLGTSSSTTVSTAEPVAKPAACAETRASFVPSTKLSFGSATENSALDSPAAMVTVAGTSARQARVEPSETTSGAPVGVLRVTVPTSAAPASVAVLRDRLTVSAGASLSAIASASRPSPKPAAVATRFAVRPPSTSALSATPMSKPAEDAPAAMVTVAGSDSSARSLDSATTSTAEVSPLRVTVPRAAVTPAFSAMEAGATASVSAPPTVIEASSTAVLLASLRSNRAPAASTATTIRRVPSAKAGSVTAALRGALAPAAMLCASKTRVASRMSPPGTASSERKTRSTQEPVAGASPVLATVQETVTGRPATPVAGAAMEATTRSGYSPGSAARDSVATLFDPPVPAALRSKMALPGSAVTRTSRSPAPRAPSGRRNVSERSAEVAPATSPSAPGPIQRSSSVSPVVWLRISSRSRNGAAAPSPSFAARQVTVSASPARGLAGPSARSRRTRSG